MAIVRKRADWVSVLDATYDPVVDDATWADQILETAQHIFERPAGMGLHVIGHDPECVDAQVVAGRATGCVAPVAYRLTSAALNAVGPDGLRAFYYPPLMVTTHSEIGPMTTPMVRAQSAAHRAAMGVPDLLGIVVHPEPGLALVLYSTLDTVASPTKHERHLLAQLGLHLAAAYRLRRRPEIVHAVLSQDGKIVERTGPTAGDAIAGTVRRVEASRSRTNQADLLGLWTALVAGRYSLVPRSEGGRRRYLVLENAISSQVMRALTTREVDVLSMSARGLPTKLVAYGLGISTTAVSSALGRATSKLGLSSRLELVRLAATIIGDPRVGSLPTTITAAESEILALLRQGMSNVEIARLRSRSVHTIANQVSSLLKKTASSSRRALP